MPSRPNLIQAIDRTPLVTKVMERVRALIEDGSFPPHTKLPSERELQQSFGVGRSTVREALRALEALGVIELRQGRGAFVRDIGGPLETRPAASASGTWRIELVMEARLVIETQTAALAALRRTQDDLEVLEQELHAFEEATAQDDLPALVRADVAFHDAIAAAANRALASSLKSLEVLGIQSRTVSLGKKQRRSDVLARHRSIYAAVTEGDPVGAAVAMRDHLTAYITELGFQVGRCGDPQQNALDSPSLALFVGAVTPADSSASPTVDQSP